MKVTLVKAVLVAVWLSTSPAAALTLAVTDGSVITSDGLGFDYGYLLAGRTFELSGISSRQFPYPQAMDGRASVPIHQVYNFTVKGVKLAGDPSGDFTEYGSFDLVHDPFSSGPGVEVMLQNLGVKFFETHTFKMDGHLDVGGETFDLVGRGIVTHSWCLGCIDGVVALEYLFMPPGNGQRLSSFALPSNVLELSTLAVTPVNVPEVSTLALMAIAMLVISQMKRWLSSVR